MLVAGGSATGATPGVSWMDMALSPWFGAPCCPFVIEVDGTSWPARGAGVAVPWQQTGAADLAISGRGGAVHASGNRRRPAIPAPLVPCRESSRWVIDRFAAVEFTWCWDVDVGGPLGEFLVRHGPSRVWRYRLALI